MFYVHRGGDIYVGGFDVRRLLMDESLCNVDDIPIVYIE